MSTTTTPPGVKRWRYKLNENWKGAESAQIGGVNLLATDWTIFPSRVVGLQRFLRTVKNPSGIVDIEEFYTSNEDDVRILNSSVPKKPEELPQKIYSLPHLSSLRHTELMNLARQYGINPANKKDKVLIREIAEAQKKNPLYTEGSDQ